MMTDKVTYGQYVRYLQSLSPKSPELVSPMPKTEAEFDRWWNKISVSPDLIGRWIERIKSVDKTEPQI